MAEEGLIALKRTEKQEKNKKDGREKHPVPGRNHRECFNITLDGSRGCG